MARAVHLVLLLLPGFRLCLRPSVWVASSKPRSTSSGRPELLPTMRAARSPSWLQRVGMLEKAGDGDGNRVATVLVTVNTEYMDMFKNWLGSAMPFLQGRQVFVVAEDPEAVEPLEALILQLRGEVNITLKTSGSDESHAGSSAIHGTKAYGELVGRRALHILDLLQRNVSVLYVDIDTAWLDDPFTDIEAAGNVDLVLTIDHPGRERPYCTCFIVAYPTAAARLVMEAWAEKVVGETTNQGVFNDALRKLSAFMPIAVKELPLDRYPHGREDVKNMPEAPVVVHANWMTGMENKITFFKELDAWRPHAIEERKHTKIEEQGSSSDSSALLGEPEQGQ